jgi:UDP-N-acetylglucosamine/UDP-N-acetylgalactosamine diphosphorylase
MSEMVVPPPLKSRLDASGQAHVLRFWDELTGSQRQRLVRQIESLDLERIAALWASRQQAGQKPQGESLADVARRAVPPASIVPLPQSPAAREEWRRAQQTGEDLLKAGRVGAILVAGGQGTRLGFDKPKGIFPIGPVSRATLFQILAEQVLARSRRAGKPIPYFVMTSDATHEDTVAFFEEHKFFGLPPGDVFFFEQGNMPAVDAATGRLLLADKGSLSTSPDGHGGMLAALAKAGLLDEMKNRGIEFLHYHQVDNPTAIVCDPAFLGFHAERGAEMSIKVVSKRSASERMGMAVDVDGRTQIIEYSDMPPDVASKTDERGELLLWAGSTAIHVFSRSFLDRVAHSDTALPFHIAHKKVSFCDEQGAHVAPERENAYKFERFIFDALPAAHRSLVLETDRAREFNPVKNATGDDSPDTARGALLRLHRGWLREASAIVDDQTPVEISPLFAVDADELRAQVPPGIHVTEPTFFSLTTA